MYFKLSSPGSRGGTRSPHHRVQIDQLGLERCELPASSGTACCSSDAGLLARRCTSHAIGLAVRAPSPRLAEGARREVLPPGTRRACSCRPAAVVVAELRAACCHGAMPGQTGIARGSSQSPRKPSRPGTMKGSSSREAWLDDDAFFGHALSCGRCVKVELLFRRKSAMEVMPRDQVQPRSVSATPGGAGCGPARRASNGPMNGQSRGSKQCRPPGTSGRGPASISRCRLDLVRDLREERDHRTGDVGTSKEIARVGMPELLVQVQNVGGRDPHAAGRGDAGLDRASGMCSSSARWTT